MSCVSDCSYTSYQVSALSRIAHGSQSADRAAVASSQTVSVKGSSIQVTIILITQKFFAFSYVTLISHINLNRSAWSVF